MQATCTSTIGQSVLFLEAHERTFESIFDINEPLENVVLHMCIHLHVKRLWHLIEKLVLAKCMGGKILAFLGNTGRDFYVDYNMKYLPSCCTCISTHNPDHLEVTIRFF